MVCGRSAGSGDIVKMKCRNVCGFDLQILWQTRQCSKGQFDTLEEMFACLVAESEVRRFLVFMHQEWSPSEEAISLA